MGGDIPLAGDCVIIPYCTANSPKLSHHQNQQTINISASGGPNVIVESMPYTMSEMDTVLDIEQQFSSLVNMPDPELVDDSFFDYTNW